jgi:hypothetical protein
LYYRQATGTIQRIILLDDNNVTTTSYQNLKSSNNIGAEVNAYFQLYKWWKINSSLNYYKNTNDGTNIGPQFKSDGYSFNGKMNNNFTPWKKSMFQISANYQAPTYTPLVKNFGQYYVNAAFRQDLFNKRLSISVRCTDIFLTQRRDYDFDGPNFMVNSRSTRESRVVYFGVTFRLFGKNKKENEEENEEENDDSEESN